MDRRTNTFNPDWRKKTMKVSELADQIMKARLCYYSGNPVMSDAEFDKLFRLLKGASPDHPVVKMVGAPVSGTQKVKHYAPMGSLENAMNEAEFSAWYAKMQKKGINSIILEDKLDGLSIELIFERGIFMQAITRGDGMVGEDVTRNVVLSKSFPTRISDKFTCSIKAECLIHKKDFDEHFTDAANPRNAAAGTVRRGDGTRAEFLKIYAYAIDGAPRPETEGKTLAQLQSWGFKTPSSLCSHDFDEMKKLYDEYIGSTRDELPYEIDGLVAKVNDIERCEELGEVSPMIPRGQIAWKFPPRGNETVLQFVEWQVGHTGNVTPVGKVRPVKVGGVTVTSVTLCNPDELERLGVAIGDTVEILRAGDVIPKLSKVVKKAKGREEIEIPEICPECGRDLVRDGAFLRCGSDACPGRVFGMLMHWVKERNILGIGDRILHAMVEGPVHTACDLYKVSARQIASTSINGESPVGMARATKIKAEIDQSAKMSVADFFAALGIPALGSSLANAIVSHHKVRDVESFMKLTTMQFSMVEKIGKVRAGQIKEWLVNNEQFVEDLSSLLEIGEPEVTAKSNKLDGKAFCFTGAASMPREKLWGLVRENGGEVHTGLTKTTNYLVQADPNSNSSKTQKARKYGTEVISETAFLEMVDWSGEV
jgi:DNA ligase (NAD+)